MQKELEISPQTDFHQHLLCFSLKYSERTALMVSCISSSFLFLRSSSRA